MDQRYPFWRPFLALFVLGFIGVLSLLLVTLPQLDDLAALQPELAELPTFMVALVVLVQPAFLLGIATAIGCLLAHRVGLVSFVSERAAFGTPLLPRLRPQIVLALVLGLVFSVVVLLLDALFVPFLEEAFQAIEMTSGELVPMLVMGMLYGGITEELLLRWGFMTLLVWAGWLIFHHRRTPPSPGVMWGALLLAALLFGIAHLPAMAALVPLTTLVVIRTVLLNAVGGVVFGWLFWRRSLEAAMVAHAATHVGFFIIRLVTMALA
jgi:hypothetical protein